MEFLRKHQLKIYLAIILALGLVKFVKLRGGVVLGEPDEQIHLEILRNFRAGDSWPVFAGRTWAYNFPLFLYLGWFLSHFFGVSYLPFRVISVLSSLALSLGTYYWLNWKLHYHYLNSSSARSHASFIAFIGALFWTLCPFAVFYSRLGLIEMLVTSLMFLSFFAFDYAVTEKRLKWSVVSGLLLSLSILTKYTAFVFVVPMFLVWVFRTKLGFIKWLRSKRNPPAGGLFAALPSWLDLYSLLPLIIAAVITLLTAFAFYLHDGFTFKLQAGQSLGIFTDWWKNVNGGFWDVWWIKTAWWVGWPVLILGIGGFASSISRSKGFLMFGFFFLLTAFSITTRKPFNLRYFLPVVPFLCVYAALGLEFISKLPIPQPLPRRQAGLATLLAATATLLLLPSSFLSLRASNHQLIEQTGLYVLANSQKLKANSFLFSNWWPRYFGEASGIKNATWLAESVKETNEFADTNDCSALTILNQEGGVVVLESLYSRDLYTPDVRKVAQDLVERNATPTVVIKDTQPNFPFYKTSYNEAKVYEIEKGMKFK